MLKLFGPGGIGRTNRVVPLAVDRCRVAFDYTIPPTRTRDVQKCRRGAGTAQERPLRPTRVASRISSSAHQVQNRGGRGKRFFAKAVQKGLASAVTGGGGQSKKTGVGREAFPRSGCARDLYGGRHGKRSNDSKTNKKLLSLPMGRLGFVYRQTWAVSGGFFLLDPATSWRSTAAISALGGCPPRTVAHCCFALTFSPWLSRTGQAGCKAGHLCVHTHGVRRLRRASLVSRVVTWILDLGDQTPRWARNGNGGANSARPLVASLGAFQVHSRSKHRDGSFAVAPKPGASESIEWTVRVVQGLVTSVFKRLARLLLMIA